MGREDLRIVEMWHSPSARPDKVKGLQSELAGAPALP